MAQQPQPPAKPPSPPPPQQPPNRPQGSGAPSQPLQPPLPAAQSSPPRQPAPGPAPYPDEPHDQRYAQGEDQDVPVSLTPEQRTALVTEPHPPQKFKRPLPQPGDKDYVQGQPVNEEEAARVEAEDEERYQRGQQSARDAEARRMDARSDEQEGEQHPGTPGKAQPDDGKPLHKPGHDKDK